MFPILPTIADSGVHRWLVVVTLIFGTICFQQSSFSSSLQTKSFLSILLWMSLLSQTLICVSELFSVQPPGHVWFISSNLISSVVEYLLCNIIINLLKDLSTYISWAVFFFSWTIPFLECQDVQCRFHAISISCLTVYCLLSTFYEGIFYIVLVRSLGEWIAWEIPFQSFKSGKEFHQKTPCILSSW